MTEQPIDKRERYVGYATCCLQMAKTVLDGQTRTTLREMALEWLKLAEHARLRLNFFNQVQIRTRVRA